MKTIEQANQVDEQLLTTLRAISNPVRFRILQILAERGVCQCGPLGADLPIAASTLSQHLKVLREAGLIMGTVDGPAVCYCRNEEQLDWLKEQIQRL